MKIERSLREVEVLALELQPPLVLEGASSVGDVIRAMQDGGHGCALLTGNNRLAGILTERDVLLSVLGNDAVLPVELKIHEWHSRRDTPCDVGRGVPISRRLGVRHDLHQGTMAPSRNPFGLGQNPSADPCIRST